MVWTLSYRRSIVMFTMKGFQYRQIVLEVEPFRQQLRFSWICPHRGKRCHISPGQLTETSRHHWTRQNLSTSARSAPASSKHSELYQHFVSMDGSRLKRWKCNKSESR